MIMVYNLLKLILRIKGIYIINKKWVLINVNNFIEDNIIIFIRMN